MNNNSLQDSRSFVVSTHSQLCLLPPNTPQASHPFGQPSFSPNLFPRAIVRSLFSLSIIGPRFSISLLETSLTSRLSNPSNSPETARLLEQLL